ncbi:alpha/beta hydrolase [Acetatifactor muris]|uniref:Carboxylesterase NlhH n=1 Tax=Acetatifactor muris TaxID=879566 RepID=A0A2K4ZE48_9FIRM|nr:alpha/beta hydrolase [Acetatifactor muris]MCR2047128.1 alpha/beta hydrolase [Acetatifactor muris]SOY28736.1 Carboxylesterase NlhH [Acetatifactor muris]
MNYKKLVHSELRHIARKVPYNKAVIWFANIFQVISFRFTRIPEKIMHRNILLEGYKGLKFRVEIFEPSDGREKLPCLIYVHGGAFSYKASAYHKKLACIYAQKANCKVFLPDYHLTPGHPYPAAYEDVLALCRYVMKNGEVLGIDSEKIGLAGDSAGAAIAALICNRYEQENLIRPCIQMLVYPLTDIDMRTETMKKFSDTPLWNSKNNRRMWSYYCGNLKKEDAYGASPMHSALPRSIPDTYVETVEYDCLHDEGILYGKRLREAGANVEINETRGTIHGYDSAINTKIAIRNIKRRISFLKKGYIINI